MKYYKITVFIIIFILITSIGCDKPPQVDEVKYYKISNIFKEYALFQAGTKWIYSNESSKITDTVTIDSLDTYIGYYGIDEDENEIYRFEAIDMFLISGNNIDYKKLELSGTNSSRAGNGMNEILRLYQSLDYRRVFAPEHKIGLTYIYGGKTGFYQNVEFLSNYSINNHTFHSVFHTKLIDSTNLNAIINYHYYIAKNFGIIRQEKHINTETTIWNLIDWEIIQE